MIEKLKNSKWYDLLIGIFLMTGAFLIYYYLDDAEKRGVEHPIRNWFFYLIYKFSGKFCTSLILFLLGFAQLMKYFINVFRSTSSSGKSK
ncbi:MAG: hypothetical protein WBP45_04210 [Daejeonella sp.]